MADKRGREWGDSSSETETESDSGDTHSRNKDQKQTKKKKKYKTRYSKEWDKTYPFLKACSTHVSEKEYKFHCLKLNGPSSRRVYPAAKFPEKMIERSSRMVIVNLQSTPVNKPHVPQSNTHSQEAQSPVITGLDPKQKARPVMHCIVFTDGLQT